MAVRQLAERNGDGIIIQLFWNDSAPPGSDVFVEYRDERQEADEYIAWLDTTSGHRSIEQEARQALYERIRRRIEARPDGRVRRTYLAVLNVGPTTE